MEDVYKRQVWLDGACGEGANGKVQKYDWQRYYQVVRKLQPNAVISISGPDIRWCGNEAGEVRPSEWSVVAADMKMCIRDRITRNLSIDRIRKKFAGKRPDVHMADVMDEMEQLNVTYTVEEQLAEKELMETINRFLEEMSPKDRYIFVRRYWFLDPVSAISNRLSLIHLFLMEKSMIIKNCGQNLRLSEFLFAPIPIRKFW